MCDLYAITQKQSDLLSDLVYTCSGVYLVKLDLWF